MNTTASDVRVAPANAPELLWVNIGGGDESAELNGHQVARIYQGSDDYTLYVRNRRRGVFASRARAKAAAHSCFTGGAL